MTRSGITIAVVVLNATACASGGPGVHPVRFTDTPIVWRVDDTRDVPEQPAERLFLRGYESFRNTFVLPSVRALDVPAPKRALNINALGEVPDSSWFENRIGRRPLTPEDVFEGPGGNPMPPRPWTVLGTKIGGLSVGFIISSADGDRYLLKFDRAGHPELETGADVVVQRLLWAAGYNVPKDHVVSIRPSDFALAEDATIKDQFQNKSPLTQAEFDRLLSTVDRDPDGGIRGLLSAFLPGRPLGGYPNAGVRDDDPNDVVPHEHRRDLRGQYVFFSWLDHTDLKEDNWLDMYVEENGRHFVRHHVLDFGLALGVLSALDFDPANGYAYHVFDPYWVFLSFPTFGLWVRPWERIEARGVPGVGHFDAENFDPGAWRPRMPTAAFLERDERDDLWAANILSRFTRKHIEAAVFAGRYSDPRAIQAISDILVGRQKKILRWAFSRTNPLTDFEVRDGSLCFVDKLIAHDLARPEDGRTTYQADRYDRAGEQRGRLEVRDDRCAGPLPSDGYTIVRIETRRGERSLPPVEVHLENRRIIGIWRHR